MSDRASILCDTHAHTVASTHAYSNVHDYWAAAEQCGLQLFAITDHGSTMPDGAHDWHFGNMKVLPRVHNGIAMLRGIEANILPSGGVDILEGMRPYLDIAIASFHEPVFTPRDRKGNTQAAINAFETGDIQIFGHPGNPNFPVDQDEIVRAAKDNNVAIEINNSSFSHSRIGSEVNCIRFLELVDQHDWKVVFSSDAHSAFQLGEVGHCLEKAEAVDFPMERVLSVSPQRLLAFLAEHGKPVVDELRPWLATLPHPI